jgi:hypothetical protein
MEKDGIFLTLSIFDDLRVVSFHDGNARVGGSEIDTDDAIERS